MSVKWYYSNGDNVFGPVSAAEMRQAAADGQIHAKTVVRRGESGPWVSATKVKGLLDLEKAPLVERSAVEALPFTAPSPSSEDVVEISEAEEIVDVEVVEVGDDDIWSDSNFGTDYTQLPMMPVVRPKKRSPPISPPSNIGMYIGIAGGAFGLIVCTVLVTLWGAGVLTVNQKDAISPHSTTSNSSQKSGPSSMPSGKKVLVSGELFVTTNGGDVKKAAGQKIYFTPITPELERDAIDLLSGTQKSYQEHTTLSNIGHKKYTTEIDMHIFNAKTSKLEPNPEYVRREQEMHREFPRIKETYSEYFSGMKRIPEIFLDNASDAVANSDGEFNAELTEGEYVLWTEPRAIGDQEFSWCKFMNIKNSMPRVILGGKEMFMYQSRFQFTKGFDDPDNKLRILTRFVSELNESSR